MRGTDVPDLRDRLEYAGLSLVLGALRAGSPRAGHRTGRLLGRLMAAVAPIRRDVAIRNLRASFPGLDERAARRTYRAMCEVLGMVLADFTRMARMSRAEIARATGADNGEIRRLHAAGRPAFLLSGHFGNWEALGATFAAQGFPMTALGARQRNPLVENLISRTRERVGMRALTVRQGMLPIVREIKAGRFIATIADQDGGREGFFLDFLGRKASVQAGLFRLAARYRVPIIVGFTFLDGDRWHGEMDDAIEPRETLPGEEEAEARRLAALYLARVEAAVRRRPDHYFWVHRRWHTRPPDERSD